MQKRTNVDDALDLLENLDAAQWLQLRDLAHRHSIGALSRDAWACATAALLERVAARVGG